MSKASEKERLINEQLRETERMKLKMQEKLASEKDRMRRVMVIITQFTYIICGSMPLDGTAELIRKALQ